MKRLSIIVITITMSISFSNPSYGQLTEGKHVFGINAGSSVVSLLFKLIDYSDDPLWNLSQTPVFQFSYDYQATDMWSVGFAFSYHEIDVDWSDPAITNTADDGQLSDFAFGLRRINFGIRPLIHYGGSETVDLYSGLRLGVNNWKISMESSDPDITKEFHTLNDIPSGNLFGFQLILFGMNLYFLDFIGINLEFTIGQPHFFTGGLRFKL